MQVIQQRFCLFSVGGEGDLVDGVGAVFIRCHDIVSVHLGDVPGILDGDFAVRRKGRQRILNGRSPLLAAIVEGWVKDQVAEGLAAFIAVAGKAFGNQPTCVHRFHIVFAKAFRPIGSHGHEARHENTGNQAKGHHRSPVVVNEQAEFEKRPIFQDLRVGGALHESHRKKRCI